MTKKKKEPNQDQQAAIKKAGLKNPCWKVLHENSYSVVASHRLTGKVRAIYK